MSHSLWKLIWLILVYSSYLLPIAFLFIAWELWVKYIRLKHHKSLEWILLEIKIPKEISKSPEAMEIFLSSLQQTRDGTFIHKWWDGLLRSWFSLEIVSLGGELKFFIYSQKFFKNLIEAEIYSQYPEVEIIEVEDYTRAVSYNGADSDLELWGCNFDLTKADAYPIKTYVDYGLDSETKEEFKIDPITPIIEFMGSIQPHEQIWIQILIIAARKRFKKEGTYFEKTDWRGDAQELLKKLTKKDDLGSFSALNLSPGERKTVEAIERNISKIGFDTGIRAIYLTPKNNFKPINIVGIISMFKQFNSMTLNGFKPMNTTGFNYPWQDPWKIRSTLLKKRMFKSYRARGYFHFPFIYKPMTLNTEELATIYHFPGQVVGTPAFERIQSRRAEPPVNLPI